MIDLRSDTVTKPSQAMRKAMYEAEVGDDVYQEDSTTLELQEYCSNLFQKEASLFVSSGVMGNQLALRILTEPGDEIICEQNAHIFNYESGSASALSGIQLNPVTGIRGVMNPADVADAIRPKNAYYMPYTKVIAVENSHNRASGAVIPIENISALSNLAKENQLYFHIDGARIWNASIASGITLAEYASYADTISVCFSKGLGAPIGSLLLSTKEKIKKAFRIRKSWGGGMRQVGVLSAAALYALKNNINRLAEDHRRAKVIAECLADISSVEIDMTSIQTNIAIFSPKKLSVNAVIEECKVHGLLLSAGSSTSVRAITHLDISDSQVEKACSILQKVLI